MTEKVATKFTSDDTDTESEKNKAFQSPEKSKENTDSMPGVSGESDEYGTASGESESGDYSDEDDDDETNSDEGADDLDENDESVVLDAERQSGDGQEQDSETKKKVDDDEDRSNPQYIPKKGTFYEHDDRTAEDADAEVEEVQEGSGNEESLSGGVGKEKEGKKDGRIAKKWQASQDRWTHDRFDESEQAPKSRSELVNAYGYDIRNEDGPPRARRRRRYGRGPSKYTRNWEDESAYTKQVTSMQKKPRPEDFPALGSEPQRERRREKSHRREKQSSEYKENNDRNIERNERQLRQEYKTGSNRRSAGSERTSRSVGQRINNQRNSQEDRNANRNSNPMRQQHNTIEFINQSRSSKPGEAPNQRYETRQNYEQEQNYNRIRYQQPQEEERRHQKGSSERDSRVAGSVNQRLQGGVPQQEIMQNLVAMQQPPPQALMQEIPRVQLELGVMQNTGGLMQNLPNDANRTKRYSIQRQRQGGMEVPSPQTAQLVNPMAPQQMTAQDQSQMEAALLQQLQSEKLKQIQSNMGHQKQISYHQAIANQNSSTSAITLTQAPQSAQFQAAPQYYTTQNASPEYQQAPPQSQQPQIMTSSQNAANPAQFQYAAPSSQPAAYAYIQPQSAPQAQGAPQAPPQIFVPAPAPQQAPQYQPQTAYAPAPYPTAAPSYPAAAPAPAPSAQAIYQNQPPPNITYYAAPTAHQAPPANPPPRVARRPTNAIPILAPPDRKEVVPSADKGPSDGKQGGSDAGVAENIDHIIDNMFVRRPPIQPAMKVSPNDPGMVADAVKGLSIKDDTKEDIDKGQTSVSEQNG